MRKLATVAFLSFAPLLLWGQRPLVPLPHATLDPLPVPLRLPPGLTETLPINPQASYSSENVRLVDCPKDVDNPYGDCSNFLFGGFAIFGSQLSGYVQIDFDKPHRNIAHFYITHPGDLRGQPAKMKAPQLYEFPVKESVIFDAFEASSEGDLDLTTGFVTNFNFHANFFNTFYDALGKANPRLQVGQFSFPGAYGTAYANFTQRADGLLDLRFGGTTFLPLGNQIQGDKVRIPLPLCGAESYCNTIEAPGTSLHPSIQYSTHMDEDAAQGSCPECVNLPFNSIQMFQLNTYYSSFLDRFNLNNIYAIGGHAVSRTHFQGMLQVQFGDRSGDIVPVTLMLERPEGLIGKPDDPEVVYQTYLPLSSNKGASLGWIGHNEILTFPTGLQYFPRNVTLSSDAYDFGKGAINIRTGRFIWDLQAPGFLLHNFIMKVLEQNDGRIPIASFSMRGPALIEQGNNGQWQIRADTRTVRSYENLLFPAPDFIKAHGNTAGPGSYLDPEYRFQAVLTTDQPTATFTGQYDNVRAFIGDTFSIKYSIPCDAVGKTGSFTYTNTNPDSGGTFTMQNLGSVHCTNTKISTTKPGDYDAVSFTAFGLWSRDPDEKDPHVATVHIFPTSPDGPYISVQVDGGIASLVHTKPQEEILP
jgi:hypothetical protein